MDDELQIRISVVIYNRQTQQNLNVSEEFILGPGLGFTQLRKILGQFHDLASAVRSGNPVKGQQ